MLKTLPKRADVTISIDEGTIISNMRQEIQTRVSQVISQELRN